MLRRCLMTVRVARRHRQTCALEWPREDLRRVTIEEMKRVEEHWRNVVARSVEQTPCTSKDAATLDKSKAYVLSMFPYPSGALHMGHARVYTFSDLLARFYRLRGYSVLHPIGWDAFGLPAENAAIERKENPAHWTTNNIEQMRKQLQRMCITFDWEREVRTCDPAYYSWTQWLFLQLHEHGYVTYQLAHVNWDPVDKTVLADEQIDSEGRSWRSGAVVEKKLLRQWAIKTPRLAKNLYDGLDAITENWHGVANIQRSWIGMDCGRFVAFDLPVVAQDNRNEQIDQLQLLLEDASQLLHAQFVIVRQSHPLCQAYKREGTTDVQENEICLLPIGVLNPVTSRYMPLVYSTDEEYMFAEDNAKEQSGSINVQLAMLVQSKACDDGERLDSKIVCLRDTTRDMFEALDPEKELLTHEEICEKAKDENWGGYATSSRLRDWVVSRQRYWGTPIPMVHCESCGVVPVPEKDLPVKLPLLETLPQATNDGRGPLSAVDDWVNVECPECGAKAKRDTDTLDTFFDSSWYFLRYCSPQSALKAFEEKDTDKFMPVDIYVGGIEHATLHLFYARFIGHFLHSLGLLKQPEPFVNLLPQGVVKAPAYVTSAGQFVPRDDVEEKGNGTFVLKATGEPVEVRMEKMSKSKYNGVDPLAMIDEVGVDVTRAMLLSDASPYIEREFDVHGQKGVLHWLARMSWCVNEFVRQRNEVNTIDEESVRDIDERLEKAYANAVTYNMAHSRLFNVAISRLHTLTSVLRKVDSNLMAHSRMYEKCLRALLTMTHPFMPHVTSELWTAVQGSSERREEYAENIWQQAWPRLESEHEIELIFYINGLRSGSILLPLKEMQKLTTEAALEKALKQKRFEEIRAERPLTGDVQLTLLEDYGAELHVSVVGDVELKPKSKQQQRMQA